MKYIEDQLANAKSLDHCALVLEELLSKGYSIWSDGTLYQIKQLVARVNGLSIEVYAKEHPPPHFHIFGGGIDAAFSISDCAQLNGDIDGRQKALIEWWYARSRSKLIAAWNATRPSDCPVGPIQE